jgi:hypothetical protein
MDHIATGAQFALPAAVLAIGYWWHIRRHPWMPCRHCGGSGKKRHLSAKPYGRCWWCRGKGERLRPAARVLRYDLATGRKRGHQ